MTESKREGVKLKQLLLTTILLTGILVLITVFPAAISAPIGVVDFRPYWSSSFLLSQGQDFSDPVKMEHIERTLTGWGETYPMQAWFAPTGNLILLPYTIFSFYRAAYYWLLTNIAILFLCAILLWRYIKSNIWVPLVVMFTFSMTLVSLFAGQINTWVLLGLVLFLYFSESKQNWAAGASLVLVTIKPHLVILTLPLILANIVWRKEWQKLAGFISALMACSLVLFSFYPDWILSSWKLVSTGMNTIRDTPTLNGLMVIYGELYSGKWIWVPGVALGLAGWWLFRRHLNLRRTIDISVMAGFIISPVGWSYDQIILLLPIIQIIEWIVSGCLSKRESANVLTILIAVNGLSYYGRILWKSEVYFFWVPMVIAAVYLFVWRRIKHQKRT